MQVTQCRHRVLTARGRTHCLQRDADGPDLPRAVDEARPQSHAASWERLRELRLRSPLALKVPRQEEICEGGERRGSGQQSGSRLG